MRGRTGNFWLSLGLFTYYKEVLSNDLWLRKLERESEYIAESVPNPALKSFSAQKNMNIIRSILDFLLHLNVHLGEISLPMVPQHT